MQVSENKYVSIDYTLTLESGEVVDKSEAGEPLGFIVGSGQIIPGLERELVGLEQGAQKRVTVEPDDGYGAHEPDLVQILPREAFPTDIKLEAGVSFHVRGPHGPVRLTVNEVNEQEVKVDLNHPLAGKRLCFDIKLVEVREPTEAELEELHSCSDGDCGGCGGGCGCDCG